MPARSLLKYWIPVAAWMLLIFVASGDLMSAEHTSRFIGPFLLWFTPNIEASTIASVQLVVRKCAHLTEYAVLAALLWRAFNGIRPGFWSAAVAALAIAAVYASFDEFHQSFIPSRTGAFLDVLIDSCGAAIGLAVCAFFGRRKRTF